MSRAHEWLSSTEAKWNEIEKTWTFPSGATLTFGYLKSEVDKYRYQGAAFQFIGFDELTQFTVTQYTYLFSRLRRTKNHTVPLCMRGATNPGGEGHGWVYERFIVGGLASGRMFIPAGINDNPYLDTEAYIESLSELDEITKKQLLDGLWVTDPLGKPFKAKWWRGKNRWNFAVYPQVFNVSGRWISWDTGLKDKEHNAYSAYVVFEAGMDWRVRVRYAGRGKMQFPELIEAITDTAKEWNRDGKLKGIVIEDKASGTSATQTISLNNEYARLIAPFLPTTDKMARWQQAAVWCKRDAVEFPYPDEQLPFLADFEHEIFNVPDTEFKDWADAFAQGVIYLEHYCATWWAKNGKVVA